MCEVDARTGGIGADGDGKIGPRFDEVEECDRYGAGAPRSW
jgi:hypothetical protein